MLQTLSSNSVTVLWRSALVRLPRYVPTQVLRFTDPDGPYPVIIDLPSPRGNYSIPLYIFIKREITPDEAAKLPVIVDFHGGGFVLGSCLEQAPFCSQMARELGAVVISVDYRMGPVDKFPAAIEDAEDVVRAILEPSSKGGVILREAVRDRINENWATLMKTEKKDNKKEERREYKRTRKEEKRQRKVDKGKLMPRDPSPVPSSKSSLASSVRSSIRSVQQGSTSTISTPMTIDLDSSRIAISGFSSGANLALNLGLSVTNQPDAQDWPCVFPKDYQYTIPLLLYFPSLDSRQLPSERTLPAEFPAGNSFWSETADILAPSYLPRNEAGCPRASPGLADVHGIHDKARMLLVLPGMDNLAEQSEIWVKKMIASHRAKDLRIERYPQMKHGWTQMPDGWLSELEKKEKFDIYQKTAEFTRRLWEGDESVLKIDASTSLKV